MISPMFHATLDTTALLSDMDTDEEPAKTNQDLLE